MQEHARLFSELIKKEQEAMYTVKLPGRRKRKEEKKHYAKNALGYMSRVKEQVAMYTVKR